MPGCCPPQPALGSGNVQPLYPQALEPTGLKSFPERTEAAERRNGAASSARAESAWRASVAEQRRRAEWMAISLPHNSCHLFARLPFEDAVRLAALVGTGQMAWAEINAALDARIKLVIAGRRRAQGHRSPAPHDAWEEARRIGEDEIWARYHAKCDAVFAQDADTDAADPWTREQLRATERILDRLRSERDRALASLNRRMGPPRRQSSTERADAAIARTQLTAAEHGALDKLDASGFLGSHLLADAIQDLAAPLIEPGA